MYPNYLTIVLATSVVGISDFERRNSVGSGCLACNFGTSKDPVLFFLLRSTSHSITKQNTIRVVVRNLKLWVEIFTYFSKSFSALGLYSVNYMNK